MPFPITPLGTPLEPKGGIPMTLTTPPGPDNKESRLRLRSVVRGIDAVSGLLLAAAATISAVTGLIVALTRH